MGDFFIATACIYSPAYAKVPYSGVDYNKYAKLKGTMIMDRVINQHQIESYRLHLIAEEKSTATMEKYLRDVLHFQAFAGGETISREVVMAYKNQLTSNKYKPRSINSMLAALFSFLDFMGWQDAKVKTLKIQREVYTPVEKELSKTDYMRLLGAAKNNPRISLIMETIASTGIRVSELQNFTVEAISAGEVCVTCKGKNRKVLLTSKLRKKLLCYAKEQNILTGVLFQDKYGNPMHRSRIWLQMKQLCSAAGVAGTKVFPHNLRKLFARVFYGIEKDIAKLADILGHSSVDTTRIYIMTTGTEHLRHMERMHLVT